MTIKEWYKDANVIRRLIIKLKYRFGKYHKKMSLGCFLYYSLDRLSKEKRDAYIFDDELERYEQILNDSNDSHIFNSKKAFYEVFADFMGRDILFLEQTTLEEFVMFLQKNEKIILKPDDQYGSHGIIVIKKEDYANKQDLEDIYRRLKKNGYIAEEFLIGHEVYNKIYDKALNTIRVNTLVKKDGSVQIFSYINQWGSGGAVTDNDEYKGIWTIADIDTGIVYESEKDADFANHFTVHPDSGISLIGFQNINVEEVKKLVIQAARKVPTCRLIGWDVAVLENGSIELIEGNVTPELGILQATTKEGLRPLFDSNI